MSINNEQKLSELISRVETISPRLVDHWQAMAIVESLGYTDRIIKEEFGFADVLSIGKYIYERHCPSPPTSKSKPHLSWKQKAIAELYIFAERFSRSFVYAIPLLALLLLGNREPTNISKFLPLQLVSLFTLATLASLIGSGGFVQMISRRGEFYLGLGFPAQARRACISLLGLGISVNIALALVGLWFGFYRGLFADEYLILAAGYYLLLSVLWMLLAILALQWRWGTPLTLVVLTVSFLVLRLGIGVGALEAQIAAIFFTLIAVSTLIVILFTRQPLVNPVNQENQLPRLSATVYLLAPFFGYGIVYFSFIFADRLVAGWAVTPASGLVFAIDSAYQRAMDLALLNFLLLVPLVEYLAYKLIRYWYEQSKVLPSQSIASLSQGLRRRYWLIIEVALLFFGLSVTFTVKIVTPMPWATVNIFLTLIGCLGYLLLALGLLNAIVLFSLNLVFAVLASLFPSLLLNFIVGYVMAKLIAPDWAVLGLVFGSTAFMLLSSRQVLQAIQNPDYAYYLGGY
jgi:hypothetical protein